jgi:hypothetical protein
MRFPRYRSRRSESGSRSQRGGVRLPFRTPPDPRKALGHGTCTERQRSNSLSKFSGFTLRPFEMCASACALLWSAVHHPWLSGPVPNQFERETCP